MNYNNYNKKRKSDNTTAYIAVFMAVLFVISSVFTVICFCMWKKSQREYDEYRNQVTGGSDSELRKQIDALTSEKEELEKKYNSLSEQYKRLLDGDGTSDPVKLREQIDELQKELDERQKEIDELKERINNLMMNAPECEKIKSSLDELLKNGAPTKKVVTVNEDGSETEEYVYPNVAVYYQNLESGYSYSYNSDYVFKSASCMKAPLALSIFLAAEKEDEEIANGLKSQEDRIYDFDRIFTYSEDKYKSGTGRIKKMPYGTQLTYYQLIEYMIRYSDCVALKELLRVYKATNLANLAHSLGTSAMKSNVGRATVSDAGRVMEAIYNYIEEGHKYSADFKSWLINSGHPVMIKGALPSKEVAHKYGWDIDSYNDWAIVYDDSPYVVAFMSDYDDGGAEFNAYVKKIVKLLDELNGCL